VLKQLLPQRIDNDYSGHRLALWLFGLVVSVKIVQNLVAIFAGHSVLISADGIPLDTFTPAGAQTLLAVWALSGLYRLILYLLCVLVLMRYRSAIPFMFAVQALEFLAARVILHFIPLVRIGTPPGPIVNRILFALMIVGLVLSLWNRGERDSRRMARSVAPPRQLVV
jgi:hypothetical protein